MIARWTYVIYLIGIVGLLNVQSICAQQLPQSSMYWLNPFQWNVAAAGSEQTLVATAGYRKQWQNLVGAPETQQFNAHMPVEMLRSGAGLSIQNDRIGAHQVTGVRLAWSYHILQTRIMRVSLGAGVGFDQYRLDGAALRTPDGAYDEQTGLFTHNDDYLTEGVMKAGGLSTELGIWLQTEHFRLGLTAEPTYAQAFTYDANKRGEIRRPNHFAFMASYTIPLVRELELTPAMHIQSDGVKSQSNIGLQLSHRNSLFGGIGFRGGVFGRVESVTYLVGGRINQQMVLGYAYDSVSLPLNASARASHELLLRYTLNKPLGKGKLPPLIYNPRYL